MTVARSNRADVRNPILRLPSAAKVMALPEDARRALADVLMDISTDARAVSQSLWENNKPTSAAYWVAKAIDAKHIARVARKGLKRSRARDEVGQPRSDAE